MSRVKVRWRSVSAHGFTSDTPHTFYKEMIEEYPGMFKPEKSEMINDVIVKSKVFTKMCDAS